MDLIMCTGTDWKARFAIYVWECHLGARNGQKKDRTWEWESVRAKPPPIEAKNQFSPVFTHITGRPIHLLESYMNELILNL